MNQNIIPIEDYLNIIDMKDVLYTEYNESEYSIINKPMRDKIILTKNHIKLSKRQNGWFKEQLLLLNIEFPPPRGWKNKCVGKSYDKDIVEQFINYQNKENTIDTYFGNLSK